MDVISARSRSAETGATAVEYALMITLIALAIFSSVLLFGGELAQSFQDDCNQMFGSC